MAHGHRAIRHMREQQHAARGQHPLPSSCPAPHSKTEVVSMPGMKLCAKLATRQREQRVTVLEKLIIFCTQTPARGRGRGIDR